MEVWRGMGEGLSPLIVNPSTLLGYGDWNQTSCGLIKTAYREFPWYMNGSNGFTDVEDAARAIIALMDRGIRNERFIISGENRTYREIFNWMAQGLGKNKRRKKRPVFGRRGLADRKNKIAFSDINRLSHGSRLRLPSRRNLMIIINC